MKDKKITNKQIIIVLISVFLIALLGFAIAVIVKNASSKKDFFVDKSKEITYSKDENRNLPNEIKEYNKNYPDAKAWIKVPGTSIDSIVFQTDNNEKYIRNDKDNVETRWGENFVDYRCDLNNINKPMNHIILYGHNTEIDSRFTPLFSYKDKVYLDKHKFIEFATLNQTYKFEVFSVYSTSTDFYYIDTAFRNMDEYEKYINKLKDKSEYNTDVNVSKEDIILTLSTCDYNLVDGRFVVHAKLVKDGSLSIVGV